MAQRKRDGMSQDLREKEIAMCTHSIKITLNIPIPDWANWLAQDSNGAWWVYSDKPVISEYSKIWAAPTATGCKFEKIAKDEPNPGWENALYRIEREL